MTKNHQAKNKKNKKINTEPFASNSIMNEEDSESADDNVTDDELDNEGDSIPNTSITKSKSITGNKHLLELKETLELASYKQQINSKAAKRRRQKERKRLKKAMEGTGTEYKNRDFVETLASKMGKADNIIPEVVLFKDPRKKSAEKSKNGVQTTSIPEKGDSKEDVNKTEISMKEARFDVFKFGARGLDKKGQHEARVMLALTLGAKPEKNKCLPYEKYKEQKRIEKVNDKKDTEMKKIAGILKPSKRSHKSLNPQKGVNKQTQFKNSISQGKNKGLRKSSGSKDKGGIQPKIGKFDGGMLRLSKKDIEKIKG